MTSKRVRLLASVEPGLTRVAVLEEGKLVELLVERSDRKNLLGNVYRGRVSKVVQGMQAAFVDVGLGHDVFLPFDQIGGRDDHEPPGDEDPLVEAPPRPMPQISAGQALDVQIVKEPFSGKGARATTQLTFAGRYLVLMPGTEHVGISRRIEDEDERTRLLEQAAEVRPEGMGLIVRTAALGRSPSDFKEDRDFLMNVWKDVQTRSSRASHGELLYRENDLLAQVVRDLFDAHVDEFIIDSQIEHARILEVCRFLPVNLQERFHLYRNDIPLLEKFGVEQEIEKALAPRVWLPSGGYLIIEQTEAFATIDVNSGRYIHGENLEATVFKTNLEAVGEIARQVRLRNLAGLIVIDFIDMLEEDHRTEIQDRFRKAFETDRARTYILDFTELGILQMTRQRTRASLASWLTETCPHCRGLGRVLSPVQVGNRLFQEIRKACGRGQPSGDLRVTAHPEVARYLMDRRAEGLRDIQERTGKTIHVRGIAGYHPEETAVTHQAQEASGDEKLPRNPHSGVSTLVT